MGPGPVWPWGTPVSYASPASPHGTGLEAPQEDAIRVLFLCSIAAEFDFCALLSLAFVRDVVHATSSFFRPPRVAVAAAIELYSPRGWSAWSTPGAHLLALP